MTQKNKKLIGSGIISVLLILVYWFNLFSFLEYKLEDWLYQNPTSASPEIAVIGIDEESFSELGRYQQWSRQIMADAVNILNSGEEKPAVIAIDVLYTGESDDPVADANLAKAAADGGNVVTASQAVVGDDKENLSLNKVVTNIEVPYPALASAAAYGLVNATVDSDSLIRNAMLQLEYNNEYVYSFPYEIYKKYTGGDSYLGDELYITYYGEPGEFFQMSFSDIFAEDFEPEFFADCIVMIGPYAPAMMDAYYTPISQDVQMYGVEIHANVVQMLLEGNFKRRCSFEAGLAILLSVIAIGIALSRIPDIRVLLGATAAAVAGYIVLAQGFFNNGLILMLLYPIFSLVILYLYELIYGYIVETLEKQRVKNVFKKYVDPKLVDKLVETGEAHSDEVGTKKDIAVLFVDIRGFTPMSEALKDEPEMVVRILNEYLELTSNAIFNNGGSVDKFIGDATMALFNGFVPLDDYVFRAVKTAWDIVQGAAEVNASIKEKYGVDVGFGVGVNCGEAIVGNLGPSFRKDYTAIGDTVNTAARLEANAKRSQALISRKVYDIVKDRVEAESVGEIPLKGKSIKMEVFAVTGVHETK